MKNILITGSKGQLGSEFQSLQNNFAEFVFHFFDLPELDITNKIQLQKTVKELQINTIINCAAYTSVDKAEDDKENAFKVNAEGVKILAEVAKESEALLIHISTDYIFNGTASSPYKEDEAKNPLGVYGESKWQGEEAIRKVSPSFLIIRTSWLYSTFGSNFVKTMQRLGKERKTLHVISDQVGTPTYARDLAWTIMNILKKTETGIHYTETYHFSNEGVCSWYDFATAIMEISKLNCEVLPVETHEFPTPAARPAYSVLCKSKIKQQWDIQIPHWRKSLVECIKELKN